MRPLKRAAVLHSLAGFGKCSLTIALPVLSAAGVEACPLPTSVLSTHTGGLDGFTHRDLTGDMLAYGEHWHSLGLSFDVIYTGFLGSVEQISIVCQLIDLLKGTDTLVAVDPCMGDDGKLYRVFDDDMIAGMRRLCARADLLLPNRTEAAFLLDEPYRLAAEESTADLALLRRLCALGPRRAVLTGARDEAGQIGALAYDAVSGQTASAFAPCVPGHYHGTGDLFASVLLAGLARGLTLPAALPPAVRFTQEAIARTREAGVDPIYGVLFEPGLASLPMLLETSR